MPEIFSGLKELHEKLWKKATEEDNGMKKIYIQLRVEPNVYSSPVPVFLLPIEQQTYPHTLLLKSPEIGEGIPWESVESGYIKVKANLSDGPLQYYDPEAKGGRKKTRRRKGGKKRKTRKRIGGGLFKGKSTISSDFESGNINHIKNVQRKKDVLVVLEINDEPYSKNVKRKYQNWFYFKSNDVQRKSMTYKIQNINIFGNDWKGFNVCYSYDNKNWKRIKTSFSKKNKTLTWNHKSTKKNVYYAYYPPYTTKMKQKLMNTYKDKKGVKAKTLGKSGVDALILGNGPLNIFIVARQHPGESIGSWMIEGFLKQYFQNKQRKLIESIFTVYVIPMANPDGVKLGHWYTNKNGQNLNRSWRHNKTPETNDMKRLMQKENTMLYLDLHGDEGSSKHFITTCMEPDNKVHEGFNKIMALYCPNYQMEDYYKRHTHKVYGTMDCFDRKRTLTIEGAMKHPIFKHKTIQNEGIEIGKAIFKTIFYNIL